MMANTQSYNYNYPIELRQKWKMYQSEYHCLTESHAVINLIVLGLRNLQVPELLFNHTETERFTMKLPVELIQEIDETKESIGATTRIQAIHRLIARGLYIVDIANEALFDFSVKTVKTAKKPRIKRKDGSEKPCSSIERKIRMS